MTAKTATAKTAKTATTNKGWAFTLGWGSSETIELRTSRLYKTKKEALQAQEAVLEWAAERYDEFCLFPVAHPEDGFVPEASWSEPAPWTPPVYERKRPGSRITGHPEVEERTAVTVTGTIREQLVQEIEKLQYELFLYDWCVETYGDGRRFWHGFEGGKLHKLS